MNNSDSSEGSECQENCKALAPILDRIGDKWTIMVVGVLSQGTMRFSQLQRRIPGVSHKMLTTTLRSLERDGLVKRVAFAVIPPRVEYSLTDRGSSLKDPLSSLAAWAREHHDNIVSSREIFDRS